MTAAARAELQAAAENAAKAAADCRQTAEQLHAARTAAERFTSRLATPACVQQRHA